MKTDNIKKAYCALGLPIEITNKNKSVSAIIELNKDNFIVCTYYKVNGKEYPKGNSVYLNDVSDTLLKSCYPTSILKRIKLKYL